MSDLEQLTDDNNTEPSGTPEATVVPDKEPIILPKYMIAEPKGNAVLFSDDVSEEQAETGCGCDSDMEADGANDILSGHKRLTLLGEEEDDTNEVVLDNDEQFVYVGKGAIKDNEGSILKIASVPDGWVCPPPNEQRNEVAFEDIDNPGDWSDFCYRPRYKKQDNKLKYWRHTLPAGAIPARPDENGNRTINGWDFHYKGWSGGSIEGLYRAHTFNNDLFPETRNGYLDADMLRRMGMSKKRATNLDALFFYQLLLPICDVSKSGVEDDQRMPFYSKVEEWSNIYALGIGLGGTYGHTYKNVTSKELVRFDGCVVRDGVRGGSGGALYRWWMEGTDYDDNISSALTYRRFIQIKRVKKLCNNSTAPKRGEEGYDPTYKYDYIFKTIVHNINLLSKLGELDITGDETSWATASFGEAGAGIPFVFKINLV